MPDMLVKKGDPFPEFELFSHTGTNVTKGDLLGQASVVWFYPKAATPGWTKESIGFRDEFAKYTALGVKVFGISYDSVADNNKFATKHDLPFLLLSDSKRELAIKLGLAKDSDAWFAPRISYIVSQEGVILDVIDVEDAGAHAKTTLELLDTIL